MSSSSIKIRGVNKRFGSNHAVRNLDLDVPAGSLCGFLGPNGAGKSTTIRMIMSIIGPDEGTIEVLGGDALANKDRIGYLPEERGVYRKMRVADFLGYIGQLKGLSTRGLPDRVMHWLKRLELDQVARQKCEELSKGMQQKVQFIAAILHEPELLILDEPFSGLDPVNAELLNRLIDELHHAGTTIIFSTHVLHQAEQLCDRIFLINQGTKLLDDSLAEIRRHYDPRTILAEPLDGTGDLAALPGVTGHRPGPDGRGVELEFAPDADPQGVMRAVLAQMPVRSIELRRPSLEEIFVRLVAEDLGDDAADRAREELRHA